MDRLTAKQMRFVREYLVDLNATQAAVRAGYSEDTAAQIGYENLQKPEIKKAIDDEEERRAQRTLIDADEVVIDLYNRMTADPNELVEMRRVCCRYCWGEGFQYQYTPAEMRERRRLHDEAVRFAQQTGEPLPAPFDPQGGEGFDATREPHFLCPECSDEGRVEPYFKDTRNLSPQARALYAGVKVTKEGIEVKMRSQDDAVEKLGKHLGVFKETVKVEAGESIIELFAKARARVRGAQAASQQKTEDGGDNA